MDKQPLEFEPYQRRVRGQSLSQRQFEKTELHDIAGHSLYVFGTTLAGVIMHGLDRRDRAKVRHLVLMVAGALVTLFGVGQLLAIELLKSR